MWSQHEERTFEATVKRLIHDRQGDPIPPGRPADWGCLRDLWHAARAYRPVCRGQSPERPTLDGVRLAVASALARGRFQHTQAPKTHGFVVAALAEAMARFYLEAEEDWDPGEQWVAWQLIADAPRLVRTLSRNSNVYVVVRQAGKRARKVLTEALTVQSLKGAERLRYLKKTRSSRAW